MHPSAPAEAGRREANEWTGASERESYMSMRECKFCQRERSNQNMYSNMYIYKVFFFHYRACRFHLQWVSNPRPYKKYNKLFIFRLISPNILEKWNPVISLSQHFPNSQCWCRNFDRQFTSLQAICAYLSSESGKVRAFALFRFHHIHVQIWGISLRL